MYLYSQPDLAAPFVTDIGLFAATQTPHPSTTFVSDIGARAAAGQQLVVSEVQGDWTKVWWLGAETWIYNPASAPTLLPSQGQMVTPVSTTAVPVYGRAYPEASAYPAGTTVQSVVPLQYSIAPGQQFVLADADIETDYYKIWFGHRIAHVRAADVTIQDGVATAG